MRIVQGNKQTEFNPAETFTMFERIEIDLGTGDGKFVYKNAISNHETLYIGIDPSATQLEIYSKKAVRKKLNNALFVVGSVEQIPFELKNVADKIYVILPWGSLLQGLVVPIDEIIENIVFMLKSKGELLIVLGYSAEYEPSETRRLKLPDINEQFIKEKIIPDLAKLGLKNQEFSELDKTDIKSLGTSWSGKLTFGKDRKIFMLKFVI